MSAATTVTALHYSRGLAERDDGNGESRCERSVCTRLFARRHLSHSLIDLSRHPSWGRLRTDESHNGPHRSGFERAAGCETHDFGPFDKNGSLQCPLSEHLLLRSLEERAEGFPCRLYLCGALECLAALRHRSDQAKAVASRHNRCGWRPAASPACRQHRRRVRPRGATRPGVKNCARALASAGCCHEASAAKRSRQSANADQRRRLTGLGRERARGVQV